MCVSSHPSDEAEQEAGWLLSSPERVMEGVMKCCDAARVFVECPTPRPESKRAQCNGSLMVSAGGGGGGRAAVMSL